MLPSRKISNPYRHIKREGGKRSGLETQVAATLAVWDATAKGEKEIDAIEFTIMKPHKYHPDFRLSNGIIIETKGWFKREDRQKHLAIKYQHPEYDIRFVFSNPNNKIDKRSKTTYAEWCDKCGFKWAAKDVPLAWIKEPCKHDQFTYDSEVSYGATYHFKRCDRCSSTFDSKRQ